jgi:hypothetical protein
MMTHDDMNQPRREETGAERSRRPRDEQVSDREVPIRHRRTPAAVHAWLDGDLPEAAVRRGDMAKDVEFWEKLNEEADQRRRMRTPAHVYQQIMDALPQNTPTVITPWWRRPFALTPAAAVAVGLGILAIGAAVTAIVMHAR